MNTDPNKATETTTYNTDEAARLDELAYEEAVATADAADRY